MRRDRTEMNKLVEEIEWILRDADRPLRAQEICERIQNKTEGILWRVRDRLMNMPNIKVIQHGGRKHYSLEE